MQLLNFTQSKMLEELRAQFQLHQVGRSEPAKANICILNRRIQIEPESQLDRCSSGFGNMDERNTWLTEQRHDQLLGEFRFFELYHNLTDQPNQYGLISSIFAAIEADEMF